MTILTKDDILKGKDNIQKFTIKSLNGEIYLKPLTQGEATEVEAIQTKSMGKYKTKEITKGGIRGSAESNATIDVRATTQAAREAEVKTVYFSINNEKMGEWTEGEIKEAFSKKQFDEIYDIVADISGLGNESLKSDVEQFPED